MILYRAEGLLNAKAAKGKTIIILGEGSLGSEFTAQMAYEWGHLVLIDPDELKIENIERHHLGKSYLRQNKAVAMREYLIKEKGVPAGSIVAYSESDEKVLPNRPKADLVVVCIDDQVSCRRINVWCQEHGIPAIYGGIYPKGAGGEIISLPNPKEVCYLCAEHARGAQSVVPPTQGQYGLDPALINFVDDHPTAVPALKRTITAIAADMASEAWRILFSEGELSSRILYHNLDEWGQVAQIKSGSNELKAVAGMIGARKSLLLAEDAIRLGPPKDGWYSLETRRSYWPKVIFPWIRCPMHGQPVQLSDL